jgi:uncharacterized membrane protein
MNEQERWDLEWLKQRHSQLEEDLAQYSRRLKLLESRLETATPSPQTPSAITPPLTARPEPAPGPQPATPPPLPPVIRETTTASSARATEFVAQLSPLPASPPAPAPPQPSPAAKVEAAAAPKERVELRFGRYWAPRIGIVFVLTAFAFFANWAYETFIIKLGPPGKVSLLYVASGLLLAAGAWWQRKAASASLKNYAQVLFAGGLAAVYFTTYGAYHIDAIKVIQSPLLDGVLLLAWAGFMVWNADRKKSEVLALFAVGLAYYTSIITRVESFTLYSNLVLTLAAVFFLVRNRWAGLTLVSLLATYAAYAFWRFFDGNAWHWASPDEGLWHGTYFLISYWLVFTTAVFLSEHERLRGPNRAGFLTLNNVAFFVMFLLTMLQVREGGLWKFCIIYGTALLVCAELARRRLANEPLTKNSYLTQGLLLVTVGLIMKYTGLKLGLLLGAESVVLLTLGTARKNWVLQIGAYISGAIAVGVGLSDLDRDDSRGLWQGAALGALMAFNAFWSHRVAKESKALIRPVPTFYTALALAAWIATTWYNTTSAHFPLALAVEALVLTFSVYVLRVREFAMLGQGCLVIAQFAWLIRFSAENPSPPWWNPALLIVITLVLSHWWQRQNILVAGKELSFSWQGIFALLLIAVLYSWLEPQFQAPDWLAFTSLLAVGITAYGVFTRAWLLALSAQMFLMVSIGQFALQLSQKKPEWFVPFAPLAALAFLSFSTVKWFERKPGGEPRVRQSLLQLALIYRWVALVMSLAWVHEYIDARERTWVLALLGVLVFLWAGRKRNSEALLFSAAFSLFGLGLFWFPMEGTPTVYWPNLLAILALLGEQRVARRFAEHYKLDERVQAATIIVGGASLWLLVFRWQCDEGAKGFYLTAGWSALALVLFIVGILLRERVYRWLGLAVLAPALGRVFIFDVWKLDTLYIVASFLALGVVLLAVGYVYNRFQEKFKEWL